MHLPVNPPLLPMLSKSVPALPTGAGFLFEPKWDGFRALVFRDGDELVIQSRDEKPLDRYFPELVAALKTQLPARCVLDGEIVVAIGDRLDFEALQMRLHPAASRVALLARETPASMVFWDLLCDGDRDLRGEPFRERRRLLEMRVGTELRPPLHLTPSTDDRTLAEDWFQRFEGAGLDGVMAKGAADTYRPNERAMFKIKHARECDCVVAGFRWHKEGAGTRVGSLLLGLYDGATLQHVGVAASFTAARRQALVAELAPYRENALQDHPWASWVEAHSHAAAEGRRVPGASSRWNAGKDLSWEPLRPMLVAEVGYDHMQGSRFRHPAQFRRWRTDKPAAACTYEQLEVVPARELSAIFSR